MSFHPAGELAVTGENGKKPKSYIWNTTTCQKVHCLQGHGIVETVDACAFSATGKFVVLIAGNEDHNMAVYDTESGACVAEGKGTRSSVIEVNWQDDSTFVLVGSKLFCQVTVTNSSFKKVNGKFGTNDQRIGSCVFNGTQALTGNLKGDLYVWQGSSIVGAPKKLHGRLIDAIAVSKNHVITGGRDCKITVMNKNYDVKFTIDLT